MSRDKACQIGSTPQASSSGATGGVEFEPQRGPGVGRALQQVVARGERCIGGVEGAANGPLEFDQIAQCGVRQRVGMLVTEGAELVAEPAYRSVARRPGVDVLQGELGKGLVAECAREHRVVGGQRLGETAAVGVAVDVEAARGGSAPWANSVVSGTSTTAPRKACCCCRKAAI